MIPPTFDMSTTAAYTDAVGAIESTSVEKFEGVDEERAEAISAAAGDDYRKDTCCA